MTANMSKYRYLFKTFTILTRNCTISYNIQHLNAPNFGQIINTSSLVSSRYCQTHTLKCWKCGIEKETVFEIFCDKCNIIQEPHTKTNYFKLIGIDESYDVDLKLLTKKYRKLQGLLHPDKYTNKSEQEQRISEEYSSFINRAYNVLQSPINRALHLLCLKGEKINENEKNMDQKFLMEVMELNEEVEDAKTDKELLDLNKKNKVMLETISKSLSEALKANNISEAKNLLIRMKYYTSVSTQINNILREKGIVE